MQAGVERLLLESLKACGDWKAVVSLARTRLAAGSCRSAVIIGLTQGLRALNDWDSLASILPSLYERSPAPWLIAMLAQASLRLGRNAEAVFAAQKFAQLSPDRQSEAQTIIARALLAEGVTWPLPLLPECRLHHEDFSEPAVLSMLAAPDSSKRISGLDLDGRPGEALALLRDDPEIDPLVRENAEMWAYHAARKEELDPAILALLEAAPDAPHATGLFTYSTSNIGDDIQSLAAAQYLDGEMPLDLLDRDALAGINRPSPRRTIMNAWYAHRGMTGETWPPSKAIDPVLVSMHVSAAAAANILSPKGHEWLQQHAPIGCRDAYTQRLMRRHGIHATVTGCLTLTLRQVEPVQPAEPETRRCVWAVDLDQASADSLAGCAATLGLETPRTRTHEIAVGRRDPLFRLIFAARMLHDYAQAKLVVTSRLHCALPCIAFRTPVVMVVSNPQDPRFPGLVPGGAMVSIADFLADPETAIRTALAHPCPVPERANALRSLLLNKTSVPGDSWYHRLMRLSRDTFEPAKQAPPG
jgi:tetratricopeptide (TPR) repeat protein